MTPPEEGMTPPELPLESASSRVDARLGSTRLNSLRPVEHLDSARLARRLRRVAP
jgi:hypothetical protein